MLNDGDRESSTHFQYPFISMHVRSPTISSQPRTISSHTISARPLKPSPQVLSFHLLSPSICCRRQGRDNGEPERPRAPAVPVPSDRSRFPRPVSHRGSDGGPTLPGNLMSSGDRRLLAGETASIACDYWIGSHYPKTYRMLTTGSALKQLAGK